MNEQEREAFEAWAATYSTMSLERDDCPELGTIGYKEIEQEMLWDAWQARAALAAKAVPDGLFETAQRIVQEYANKNPRWPMWNNGESEPTIQDPHGAHAWLEQAALLAATPPAPAPEATPAQAQQAEAKPLTEQEAKALCRVGPVYAPDGVVTRTPTAYRQELEGARLHGIREAERACAEAWGVKLAGIGASTGGKP